MRLSAGFAWAVGRLVLVAIYLTSWHSYLLFHCVVETFSILVSLSIGPLLPGAFYEFINFDGFVKSLDQTAL